MPYESQFAETILMCGHKGDRIDACMARPYAITTHPRVLDHTTVAGKGPAVAGE